jgi:transketolase
VFFAGTIGVDAKQAVEELERSEGISCRLVSLYSIKPIDREAIVRAARETGAIAVVEEHNLSGGVGSAVAEVLCEEGLSGVKFRRLGLPDTYVTKIGSQRWLCEEYGIGPTGIKAAIRSLLGK